MSQYQASLQAKAPYFIEILGRHGEVKTRHRFEQLPVSIGRGYANDLILDDTNAANYHAIVEATDAGVLRIRESASQQGLLYQGKRIATLEVDGQRVVKLGHTQIRVRSAAFNGQEEVAKNKLFQQDGLLPALAGLLMLALSSLLSVWLESTDKFSLVNYLLVLALVFGLAMLWSGCWAFANRVVSGQTRFSQHLFVVSSALIVMDLWSVFSMVIAYAFSLEFIAAYGNHAMMAIAAMMVFCHLTIISDQHFKRFLIICTTLAIVGSGLILLGNYQRSGNLADELYMTHLLPPSLRHSQNQSADEFIQAAQPLKGKLDKARLEAVDKGVALLGQE